jgi:hypothetical protein
VYITLESAVSKPVKHAADLQYLIFADKGLVRMDAAVVGVEGALVKS